MEEAETHCVTAAEEYALAFGRKSIRPRTAASLLDGACSGSRSLATVDQKVCCVHEKRSCLAPVPQVVLSHTMPFGLFDQCTSVSHTSCIHWHTCGRQPRSRILASRSTTTRSGTPARFSPTRMRLKWLKSGPNHPNLVEQIGPKHPKFGRDGVERDPKFVHSPQIWSRSLPIRPNLPGVGRDHPKLGAQVGSRPC